LRFVIVLFTSVGYFNTGSLHDALSLQSLAQSSNDTDLVGGSRRNVSRISGAFSVRHLDHLLEAVKAQQTKYQA